MPLRLIAVFALLIHLVHPLDAAYDFIVVGGGTAGLTVANRLSEDRSVSVLVIEAGPLVTGEQEFRELLVPGQWSAHLTTTGQKYDWNITGLRNAELNNRTTPVLTRKIVGGATSTNGMFFDRGSRRDYDDWAEYIGDKSWGFDGLLPYFKKLETFTPPPPETQKEFGITWDWSAHGRSGPVGSTYPPFVWPSTLVYRSALKGLGVPQPVEQAGGDAIGALWIPNSVDAGNYTRSYAKRAYHDRAAGRSNYHLLTEQTVTRILFEGKKAVGVEHASSPSAPKKTVRAKKEVIVSAGAIHSPRLLLLSGVGDERHLKALRIPLVLDLPGVGTMYQDHSAVNLNYNISFPPGYSPSSTVLNETALLEEFRNNHTGAYTAGVGNYASFIPLPFLSPRASSLIAAAKAQSPSEYLAPGTHPYVVAGYKRQLEIITSALATNKAAVMEQLFQNVVLQRPLSRGVVGITSRDPFAAPAVDWRTLSNPFDQYATVDSLRFVRRMIDRPEFAIAKAVETRPGRDVNSDEGLLQWTRQYMEPTLWHHSGTCGMGRSLREGGVVDKDLRVFGLKGLRVVDASVMPFIPATHLSNTVYAIAEKAADIIKRDH